MGECLIQKKGSFVDYHGVTAEVSDVLIDKTFMKSDGEKGTGTMINNGSPVHQIGINGSVTLPIGNYDGGKVTQNVPTFTGQTVNVGKNAVTIQTNGKYASGNVIVPAVKNLVPTNIRKGMYVGGVGPGTWEGYINDDENVPFLYGTFGPGYAASTFPSYQGGTNFNKGSAGISKNKYYLSTYEYYESIAVCITKPINLSNYNSIKLLIDNVGQYGNLYIMLARNRVESWIYSGDNSNPTYNSALGDILLKGYLSFTSGQEKIQDISSYSGNAYLYFFLQGKRSNTQEFDIFYIKLE